MEGTVKFFNRIKGFGFIKGDDEKDYFVHITDIKDKGFLNEGDRVSFEGEAGDRGLKAKNIEVTGKGEAAEKPAKKEAPEEEAGEAGEDYGEEGNSDEGEEE